MPGFLTRRNGERIHVCCFKHLSFGVICHAGREPLILTPVPKAGSEGPTWPTSGVSSLTSCYSSTITRGPLLFGHTLFLGVFVSLYKLLFSARNNQSPLLQINSCLPLDTWLRCASWKPFLIQSGRAPVPCLGDTAPCPCLCCSTPHCAILIDGPARLQLLGGRTLSFTFRSLVPSIAWW